MGAVSSEDGEGSIGTFPELKRGIVENGCQICCVTNAGFLSGRHQLANIRGKEDEVSV